MHLESKGKKKTLPRKETNYNTENTFNPTLPVQQKKILKNLDRAKCNNNKFAKIYMIKGEFNLKFEVNGNSDLQNCCWRSKISF